MRKQRGEAICLRPHSYKWQIRESYSCLQDIKAYSFGLGGSQRPEKPKFSITPAENASIVCHLPKP